MITAKLSIDNSEFKKGLKDAENQTSSTMKKISNTTGNASGSMSTFAKTATDAANATQGGFRGVVSLLSKMGPYGAAAAAAITLIGTAAFGVVKGVGALTTKINDVAKTAKSVNMTANAYLSLQYACTRAGIEMQKMVDIVNKIDYAVTHAQEGNAKYREAFYSIGLSWRDLERMSPEKRLMAVNEALGKLKEQGKSMPSEMFSVFRRKDMQTINKMVNEKDFNKFVAGAGALGYNINESMITTAEKYRDVMGDVNQKLLAMVANFKTVEEVSQGLLKITKKLSENLGGAGFVSEAYKSTFEGIADVGKELILEKPEGLAVSDMRNLLKTKYEYEDLDEDPRARDSALRYGLRRKYNKKIDTMGADELTTYFKDEFKNMKWDKISDEFAKELRILAAKYDERFDVNNKDTWIQTKRETPQDELTRKRELAKSRVEDKVDYLENDLIQLQAYYDNAEKKGNKLIDIEKEIVKLENELKVALNDSNAKLDEEVKHRLRVNAALANQKALQNEINTLTDMGNKAYDTWLSSYLSKIGQSKAMLDQLFGMENRLGKESQEKDIKREMNIRYRMRLEGNEQKEGEEIDAYRERIEKLVNEEGELELDVILKADPQQFNKDMQDVGKYLYSKTKLNPPYSKEDKDKILADIEAFNKELEKHGIKPVQFDVESNDASSRAKNMAALKKAREELQKVENEEETQAVEALAWIDEYEKKLDEINKRLKNLYDRKVQEPPKKEGERPRLKEFQSEVEVEILRLENEKENLIKANSLIEGQKKQYEENKKKLEELNKKKEELQQKLNEASTADVEKLNQELKVVVNERVNLEENGDAEKEAQKKVAELKQKEDELKKKLQGASSVEAVSIQQEIDAVVEERTSLERKGNNNAEVQAKLNELKQKENELKKKLEKASETEAVFIQQELEAVVNEKLSLETTGKIDTEVQQKIDELKEKEAELKKQLEGASSVDSVRIQQELDVVVEQRMNLEESAQSNVNIQERITELQNKEEEIKKQIEAASSIDTEKLQQELDVVVEQRKTLEVEVKENDDVEVKIAELKQKEEDLKKKLEGASSVEAVTIQQEIDAVVEERMTLETKGNFDEEVRLKIAELKQREEELCERMETASGEEAVSIQQELNVVVEERLAFEKKGNNNVEVQQKINELTQKEEELKKKLEGASRTEVVSIYQELDAVVDQKIKLQVKGKTNEVKERIIWLKKYEEDLKKELEGASSTESIAIQERLNIIVDERIALESTLNQNEEAKKKLAELKQKEEELKQKIEASSSETIAKLQQELKVIVEQKATLEKEDNNDEVQLKIEELKKKEEELKAKIKGASHKEQLKVQQELDIVVEEIYKIEHSASFMKNTQIQNELERIRKEKEELKKQLETIEKGDVQVELRQKIDVLTKQEVDIRQENESVFSADEVAEERLNKVNEEIEKLRTQLENISPEEINEKIQVKINEKLELQKNNKELEKQWKKYLKQTNQKNTLHADFVNSLTPEQLTYFNKIDNNKVLDIEKSPQYQAYVRYVEEQNEVFRKLEKEREDAENKLNTLIAGSDDENLQTMFQKYQEAFYNKNKFENDNSELRGKYSKVQNGLAVDAGDLGMSVNATIINGKDSIGWVGGVVASKEEQQKIVEDFKQYEKELANRDNELEAIRNRIINLTQNDEVIELIKQIQEIDKQENGVWQNIDNSIFDKQNKEFFLKHTQAWAENAMNAQKLGESLTPKQLKLYKKFINVKHDIIYNFEQGDNDIRPKYQEYQELMKSIDDDIAELQKQLNATPEKQVEIQKQIDIKVEAKAKIEAETKEIKEKAAQVKEVLKKIAEEKQKLEEQLKDVDETQRKGLTTQIERLTARENQLLGQTDYESQKEAYEKSIKGLKERKEKLQAKVNATGVNAVSSVQKTALLSDIALIDKQLEAEEQKAKSLTESYQRLEKIFGADAAKKVWQSNVTSEDRQKLMDFSQTIGLDTESTNREASMLENIISGHAEINKLLERQNMLKKARN